MTVLILILAGMAIVGCVYWLSRQSLDGMGLDHGHTKPRGWREHNWAQYPTPQLPDQEEETPPIDERP